MAQRSTTFFLILGLFLSQSFYTLAGQLLSCLPCCRDPNTPDTPIEMQALQPIIQSTLEIPPNDDVPVNPIYRPCPNRPISQPRWKLWAPEGGWACDQSKVDFPTVECLVADMKSCGNIGENTVFYSFGAGTPDARAFRDTLQPQGTMFNDALDNYYSTYVINYVKKFGLSQGQLKGTSGLNSGLSRQDIFTGRYCEAMARSSSGTAYLVVLNYNGDPVANQDGKPGIFQNPLPSTGTNQWRRWEFGTLQQNVCIIHILSTPLSHLMFVDWYFLAIPLSSVKEKISIL